MTRVIAIPKKLIQKGEIVLLPREDYEEFLSWKRTVKSFKPSAAQKRDLHQARKDFVAGQYLKLEDLK